MNNISQKRQAYGIDVIKVTHCIGHLWPILGLINNMQNPQRGVGQSSLYCVLHQAGDRTYCTQIHWIWSFSFASYDSIKVGHNTTSLTFHRHHRVGVMCKQISDILGNPSLCTCYQWLMTLHWGRKTVTTVTASNTIHMYTDHKHKLLPRLLLLEESLFYWLYRTSNCWLFQYVHNG